MAKLITITEARKLGAKEGKKYAKIAISELVQTTYEMIDEGDLPKTDASLNITAIKEEANDIYDYATRKWWDISEASLFYKKISSKEDQFTSAQYRKIESAFDKEFYNAIRSAAKTYLKSKTYKSHIKEWKSMFD